MCHYNVFYIYAIYFINAHIIKYNNNNNFVM